MAGDDHLETEADFRRELTRILNEAASNGIDVEGGWEVPTVDSDRSDWDLEIVTLSESEE